MSFQNGGDRTYDQATFSVNSHAPYAFAFVSVKVVHHDRLRFGSIRARWNVPHQASRILWPAKFDVRSWGSESHVGSLFEAPPVLTSATLTRYSSESHPHRHTRPSCPHRECVKTAVELQEQVASINRVLGTLAWGWRGRLILTHRGRALLL